MTEQSHPEEGIQSTTQASETMLEHAEPQEAIPAEEQTGGSDSSPAPAPAPAPAPSTEQNALEEGPQSIFRDFWGMIDREEPQEAVPAEEQTFAPDPPPAPAPEQPATQPQTNTPPDLATELHLSPETVRLFGYDPEQSTSDMSTEELAAIQLSIYERRAEHTNHVCGEILWTRWAIDLWRASMGAEAFDAALDRWYAEVSGAPLPPEEEYEEEGEGGEEAAAKEEDEEDDDDDEEGEEEEAEEEQVRDQAEVQREHLSEIEIDWNDLLANTSIADDRPPYTASNRSSQLLQWENRGRDPLRHPMRGEERSPGQSSNGSNEGSVLNYEGKMAAEEAGVRFVQINERGEVVAER